MKQFSYLVLHQQSAPQAMSDSPSTDTMAVALPEALRSAAAESERNVTDVILKNGSILRGRLTHFLSTPLRSDKDEIISLITESISSAIGQLNAAPDNGSIECSIWSIVEPQDVPLQRQMVGVLKRLLKNGRAMLIEAGCSFGKNTGSIAATLISFDVFSTGLIVKTVVDSVSEKTSGSALNESLSSYLIDIRPDTGPGKNMVLIDFDFDEEGIHHRLRQKLAVLQEQFGIQQFSLTKQLFRSVLGAKYQIRFTADLNAYPLGSMILSLIGDDEELEDAITARGSIVVLEQWQ